MIQLLSISRNVTRFGLIRHAATRWNRQRRIQGQRDSALTREGQLSAVRWGRMLGQLPWHRILASDTGRAVKTAEHVNETLKLPMETDPRLREQNWGTWTGMTVAEVEALVARMPREQIRYGWAFCPPGGESREQMWVRGAAALAAAADRRPAENILVVTHEGMLRCLLNRCLGLKYLASEPKRMRPYHLHLLTCRNGRLDAETVNALDLTADDP